MNIRAMVLLTILGLSVAAAGFSTVIIQEPKGVVALPGWEEGVAFCGEEYTWVVVGPKDHTWYDRVSNITYVINQGHANDEEANQLERLAERECAALEEDQ